MKDHQIDILLEFVEGGINHYQDVVNRTRKKKYWQEKVDELDDIKRELNNLKLRNKLKEGVDDWINKKQDEQS